MNNLLTLRIVQVTSLAVAIIVFILKFKVLKCSCNLYQLPWLIWLINFILFYTIVLLDGTFHFGINQLLQNPDFFTVWSCILRLHLLGTLFSYTIIHKPFYKGEK